MPLDNYGFDDFVISLYFDEQEGWLACFPEITTVSAFGDTSHKALEELKNAWKLVKEEYQVKHQEIP